ncbi:methyl-accepting chemotaxis protein [Halomonas koreensis]|uniref:Methyl-accepting chemotaxis protein n=1 Tax=Halomonas koreensis TaxID=245385 RepID=A0ABU1G0N5_9GAMM|nr:methyl-accepting chemotaxis protein [Halomonas koreensis]MDR5866439.1 methyl-accepting chemotaxis protein [Halomonas koreensis]
MLTSLRLRILIATLVVIAVALLINGAASYFTVESHNDDQITRNLEAVAHGNAQAIEEWVDARAGMLAALEPVATSDAPMPALEQLRVSGDFMNTYIADTRGGVVFSASETPEGYDPRERPWYRQAAEAGEVVVTAPYADATSDKLVVTFAAPFYRDGDLVAVAGGDVALDAIIDIVDQIAPTPSSLAFLATADGTLVAHPDPEMSLAPVSELSPTLSAAALAELTGAASPLPAELAGADKLLLGNGIEGTDWQLVVALDEHEATAGLRGIMSASAITLVLVGLGAALLLGLLLKVVFRRLLAARDAMENVASGQGDLTRRLPEDGSDEVAQIANAFNRFVSRMESVMLTIRDSSESVHVAATEIAQGGQDLSRRTENAASSLQQTSASMEEITSTVEHTAESSRQANGLAESANEVARRGGEAVGQVVATMDGISDSSRQIGEIVTMMDSIAFQTNLLALNASVEAARAGEQGRGFAVVAGEVRQLASRSAEAAKQIKGLIDTSVERTEEGAAQVRAAGETMEEIVESVTRVTDVLGEITAATGEQSEGIGQVNVAVSELDRMTQQNAALVEESTTAAEQLKEQSDRLAEAVGGFTLGQQAEASPAAALPAGRQRLAEPA